MQPGDFMDFMCDFTFSSQCLMRDSRVTICTAYKYTSRTVCQCIGYPRTINRLQLKLIVNTYASGITLNLKAKGVNSEN